MRIRTLQIEGFTSLRDEVTLDLDGADLFAITGPTGAGKSSLLDAITYALYGRVERLSGKGGMVDLISHHRAACKVLLTFDVGSDRYRILRRTPRKGSTKILFERATEDGEWIPACEGADRVKDAQEALETALGVDYEGFTRTVLLPQGRFAAFLVGDAAQRRSILTKLLGHDRIEALGKRAREIATRAEAAAEAKQKLLEQTYADATPATLTALGQQRKELAERRAALEPLATTLAAIRDAAATARDTAATLTPLVTALSEGAATLDTFAERAAALADARVQAAAGLDAARAALDDMVRARTEADTSLAAHLASYGGDAELREADRLVATLSERQRQIAALDARLTRGASIVDEARAAAIANAARVEAASAALATARTQFEAASAALDAAIRGDLLAAVCSGLAVGDPCPVCGGAIHDLPQTDDAARAAAQRHHDDATAALDAARAAAEAARADEAAAASSAATASSHLAALETERAALDDLQSRERATLPEAIRDDADAATTLRAVIQDRTDLEYRARDATAATVDAERVLERAAQQLADRDRDIALLERDREAFPRTLPLTAVELALGARTDCTPECLRSAADAIRQILADSSAGLEAADAAARTAAQPLLGDGHSLDSALTALAAEQDALARRDGRLEGEIEQVERRITEAAGLVDEISEADRRAELFKELGNLFRGNAFIEFLQEDAMRSLSAAATIQLDRLSSGRYELAFDDNEFHVIDRWNADERRPAKTLSGGETFLASLALALSLADEIMRHRIGSTSRLESLFLDEGFGTLDQGSLDEVVDALEHLASQNRSVGVITHIPELAQRLPIRIEVEKRPEGSRVRMRT